MVVVVDVIVIAVIAVCLGFSWVVLGFPWVVLVVVVVLVLVNVIVVFFWGSWCLVGWWVGCCQSACGRAQHTTTCTCSRLVFDQPWDVGPCLPPAQPIPATTTCHVSEHHQHLLDKASSGMENPDHSRANATLSNVLESAAMEGRGGGKGEKGEVSRNIFLPSPMQSTHCLRSL